MSLETFTRFRAGSRKISAGTLNKQASELERLTRFSSGASGAEGDFAALPPDAEIVARITGIQASNPPAYSWEVVREQESLPPLVKPDYYFPGGTFAAYPAYELSGNRRVPVDGSAIAILRQSVGGPYFTFSYTEQPIPAVLASSSGNQYAWSEVQPAPGGTFAAVAGGLSGTTTVNPAFEMNGGRGILPGTFVFLSRGYCAGTTRIKVEAVVGSYPQTQSIKILHAGGGTFTLTFLNGDSQTTARIPYDVAAASLQDALAALTNCPGPVVSGSGTDNDPFIVGFASNKTFPLLQADESLLKNTQEWLFAFNNCCNDGAWYCMEPPGSTTTTQPPSTTTTGQPSTTTTAEQDSWYCMKPPVTTTTTTPGNPICCQAGQSTSVRFTLSGISGTWPFNSGIMDLSFLNQEWVLRPGAWNHPAPGSACQFSGGALLTVGTGGYWGEIYFDYIPWSAGNYSLGNGQAVNLPNGYILRFTTWDNAYGNAFGHVALYFCASANVNCCGATVFSKVHAIGTIVGLPNTITVTADCTSCECFIQDGATLSATITGTGTHDGIYAPWWSGGVATVFQTSDFLTAFCTFTCDGGDYLISVLKWNEVASSQSQVTYRHDETVTTGTPSCSGKTIAFDDVFTPGDQIVVSWS